MVSAISIYALTEKGIIQRRQSLYLRLRRKKFNYYRVDRMERISKPIPEEREGKGFFNETPCLSSKSDFRQGV